MPLRPDLSKKGAKSTPSAKPFDGDDTFSAYLCPVGTSKIYHGVSSESIAESSAPVWRFRLPQILESVSAQ